MFRFFNQLDDLLCAAFHRRRHDDVLDRRILENLTAALDIGAFQTNDNRNRQALAV